MHRTYVGTLSTEGGSAAPAETGGIYGLLRMLADYAGVEFPLCLIDPVVPPTAANYWSTRTRRDASRSTGDRQRCAGDRRVPIGAAATGGRQYVECDRSRRRR